MATTKSNSIVEPEIQTILDTIEEITGASMRECENALKTKGSVKEAIILIVKKEKHRRSTEHIAESIFSYIKKTSSILKRNEIELAESLSLIEELQESLKRAIGKRDRLAKERKLLQ